MKPILNGPATAARRPWTLRTSAAIALAMVVGGCAAPTEPGEQESSGEVTAMLGPDVAIEKDANRKLVGISEPHDGGPLAALQQSRPPLTTAVWNCTTNAFRSHQIGTCSVDPEYVLVGGAAWVVGGSATAAFLTGSVPFSSDPSNLHWLATSKDHGVAHPHLLSTFAVGIKINGLSRDQLLAGSHVAVRFATSAMASHPSATATLPSGYLAVGGGGFVDWTGAGNLLTAVVPSCDVNGRCTGWFASAKDHQFPDPARISAYVIGLRETIPGFGTFVQNATAAVGAQVSTGGSEATVATSPGAWVITGPGGHDGGITNRLLNGILPAVSGGNFTVTTVTRDHLVTASGRAIATAMQIRRL